MTPVPILARLSALALDSVRDGLARFGSPSDNAIGVPMGAIKRLARDHGTDHATACALWPGGSYEARVLALHLADPAQTRAALMQDWTATFDNWALCDTAAFQLFDKTAERWIVTLHWCASDETYIRRTGLAMIWALSVHDKTASDAQFLAALDWIEAVAKDRRDHVHSAASMALRATGKRNVWLQVAALQLSDRLAAAGDPQARKLGRAAARELRAPTIKIRG